ncbi:MAG TPA: ZIP family metal transporter [bacterium]|nr:ZIP family metal transporter [bacterium]
MTAQILLFLLIAALADVVGAMLFLMRRRWEHEALRVLVATGAGFMLAVALVEMLPESFAHLPEAGVWAIGGFLLIHVAEHVLTPHFHYGHETHAGLGSLVGWAATFGLAVHSIIDGVAIVVAAQTSAHLGILVFAAMVWHKIPGGFTLASIVLATGGTRRAAFLAATSLGLASLVGGVVYLAVQSEGWLGPSLALSSGSIIYVAATDLLPEVNKKRTVWAPLAVLAGAGIYYIAHLTAGH